MGKWGMMLGVVLLAAVGAIEASAQTLSWTDNSAGAATGFNVYRAPATVSGTTVTCPPAPLPVKVGSVAAPATTWKDPGPFSQGAPYCYEVTAFSGLIESPHSNQATWVSGISAPTLNLKVTMTGAGVGGVVASTPAGLYANRPGVYAAPFPPGTPVMLFATPKQNGSSFEGFTGCAPLSPHACTIVVDDEDPAVSAAFTR